MITTKGAYVEATRSYPVTFEHQGVTITKSIPAQFNDKGVLDDVATDDIIAAQASGMAYKIERGFVTNPEPAPVLAPEPEADAPATTDDPEAKT